MFEVSKVKNEIIEWIRETVGNCNVVIGISGGKDSTVTAMLCVEALGKDRVYGVMMPNGEQKDIADSIMVCSALGIKNCTVNIHTAYEALTNKIVCGMKDFETNHCYITNTPARLRMTTLYGIAAMIGNARVVNTCNLSEDYVGYSTKYGDSAGDFSPLSDLTKSEVVILGKECAKDLKIYWKMKDLIDKTPSDGMCGKSDEENLGFSYDTLDRYIREGVCENAEIKAKIDRMHEANMHKLRLMPKYNLG